VQEQNKPKITVSCNADIFSDKINFIFHPCNGLFTITVQYALGTHTELTEQSTNTTSPQKCIRTGKLLQ